MEPSTTPKSKSKPKTPVVDIHSHLYPPTWISLLRSRTTPPYISTSASPTPSNTTSANTTPQNAPQNDTEPRTSLLINRPGTSKPLLPTLHDIRTKVAFMDAQNINISVLSLGNPWLDFLEPESDSSGEGETVGKICRKINQEMHDLCGMYPGRLYMFATLPLTASVSTILAEIQHIKALPLNRGVVMGTSGLITNSPTLSGLDSPSFLPILTALSTSHLPLFIHPNYGLPPSIYGPCCASGSYGQVLPISLGFPCETTIATTRLYLSGTFDTLPALHIILSHGGGPLPFLAGRIEASIANDASYQSRLSTSSTAESRKSIWDIMKENIYLDGILFGRVALRAVAEAVGTDRVMFGTDHPLFPSLRGDGMYSVAVDNEEAARGVFGEGTGELEGVMGGNAVRILQLG